MSERTRTRLQRIGHAIATDPGRFAAGAAFDGPLTLLAVERHAHDGVLTGIEPSSVTPSHPVSPAREPEGGRDTDRNSLLRYGDPFDG